MTTVVRRTVSGDRMDVLMECRGVTATAVFRRKEVLLFVMLFCHKY